MPARDQTSPPAPRAAVPVAVFAVALLGAVSVTAAAVGGVWTLTPRVSLSQGSGIVHTPAPPRSAPPVDGNHLTATTGVPTWLLVALVIIGLVLLVRLAYWLWQRIPRHHVRVEPRPAAATHADVLGAPDLAELRAGARDALLLLDEVGDPKDAVVRCWLALEQAAQRSGSPRRPSDSPSEFAATVLAATSAEPEAVRTLLGLYQRARFSAHPVGLVEVQQARVCVKSLSRTWRTYEDALRASVRGPT